jgi:uncharacterized protein YcbX
MSLLTKIFIYPIKSLGGIALSQALLTRRGLEHDRRWMLVDVNGLFLTQREFPKMALLQPHIEQDKLFVTDLTTPGSVVAVPLQVSHSEVSPIMTQVFDDTCWALPVSKEADRWFSNALGTNCQLVFMPETTERQVDLKYAQPKDITSFSDGFPFLIASEASLQDLNTRLDIPVSIERFRPNLVVSGTLPWEEDNWTSLAIGGAHFYSTKPCGRCQVITIDPKTAEIGKEPLKTLATFRRKEQKVLFGLNACWDYLQSSEECVRVGDTLHK